MNSTNKTETTWFSQWFNEDYLELYRHRNTIDAGKQIELIVKTLQLKAQTNKKIIDVGCGYGRHIAKLYQKGIVAEGVDLSEKLIAIGKKKYPHLTLTHKDMRYLPSGAGYDVLLSLFTSFAYFPTVEENLKVFKVFYDSLAPEGIFWFDFMNALKVLKNLPTSPYIKEMPSGRVFTENIMHQGNQIIKNITLQETRSNNTKKYYREEVWLLKKNEIETACTSLGFTLVHCFGNYSGDSWNETSDRLILVFKK